MTNGKKLMIIVIWLSLAILVSSPVIQANSEQSTIVEIHSKDQVEINDVFFVTISIDPAEPIIGVQINLEFDPTLVQVDSVANADPSVWGFFQTGTLDNTTGKIYMAAVAALGFTVTDPADCLEIKFNSLNTSGTSDLILYDVIVTNETATGLADPLIIEQKRIIIGDNTGSEPDSPSQNDKSSVTDDNDSTTDETPGYEIIILYVSFFVILIMKKRKR